jgi:hypothetical protein
MVEGNAIHAQQLWMHIISCCRFVDGGASTNATLKLGHTNIN